MFSKNVLTKKTVATLITENSHLGYFSLREKNLINIHLRVYPTTLVYPKGHLPRLH